MFLAVSIKVQSGPDGSVKERCSIIEGNNNRKWRHLFKNPCGSVTPSSVRSVPSYLRLGQKTCSQGNIRRSEACGPGSIRMSPPSPLQLAAVATQVLAGGESGIREAALGQRRQNG